MLELSKIERMNLHIRLSRIVRYIVLYKKLNELTEFEKMFYDRYAYVYSMFGEGRHWKQQDDITDDEIWYLSVMIGHYFFEDGIYDSDFIMDNIEKNIPHYI